MFLNGKNKKKTVLWNVIYAVVVAALLICLVLIYRFRLQQREEFKQTIEQITVEETAEKAEEAKREEEEREAKAIAPADMSVVLLNTEEEKDSLQAWSDIFADEGYTQVESAVYTGTIGKRTYIYAEDVDSVQSLTQIFPYSSIKENTLDMEDIFYADGEKAPEHVDAYIVIGNDDIGI